MNTQKLLELADYLETLSPERMRMQSWLQHEGDPYVVVCSDKAEECGTACCIAGHLILKEGLCLSPAGKVTTKEGEYQGYVASVASGILGIEDSNRLFFANRWPSDLYGRYYNEPDSRSKTAAEAIRSYVATDGWRENAQTEATGTR